MMKCVLKSYKQMYKHKRTILQVLLHVIRRNGLLSDLTFGNLKPPFVTVIASMICPQLPPPHIDLREFIPYDPPYYGLLLAHFPSRRLLN